MSPKLEGAPGDRGDWRGLPRGLEVPGFTHDSAKGVCRRGFVAPRVHGFKSCLPDHKRPRSFADFREDSWAFLFSPVALHQQVARPRPRRPALAPKRAGPPGRRAGCCPPAHVLHVQVAVDLGGAGQVGVPEAPLACTRLRTPGASARGDPGLSELTGSPSDEGETRVSHGLYSLMRSRVTCMRWSDRNGCCPGGTS